LSASIQPYKVGIQNTLAIQLAALGKGFGRGLTKNRQRTAQYPGPKVTKQHGQPQIGRSEAGTTFAS
jgi:hypothetical protein